MRRGTTPTIAARVPVDLRECTELWLTLRQQCGEMTFEPSDIEYDEDDGTTIVRVRLDQDSTLRFDSGEPVYVQLRWLIGEQAFASSIGEMDVRAILRNGVIA